MGPQDWARGTATEADLRRLDAQLSGAQAGWWNGFYANRAKPCPFFVDAPDESLAAWCERGQLQPGRALDVGCGHGRNAVYLAKQGFQVEGLDYSATAIEWAKERAAQAGVSVALHCANVFEHDPGAEVFDLVYDSGCFHHLPPHRRAGYVEWVLRALKPGGHFGLSCFKPEGGSGLSDEAVYQQNTLGGGLGYTEAQLRAIWGPGFEVSELRPMAAQAAGSQRFGVDFLWVMLARKLG